uniref:S-adenosylmethionine decarboxylase proenzyme (EC) n=1 Tax=Ganoderma boninense TaxID=34458 RepID=A0A5K1JZ06_9APHY|nr:S-adenosylmethionine decarboxylase proenzyme (EC [Ganoderma boninense]
MDFSSTIFLCKDAGAEYLPGLPVRSVFIEVDRAAALQPLAIILPTDEPESINAAMIAGWLAALNGPSVDALGMLSSQREILLTVVCGYRAFLELPPGVKERDFYTLAHKLIDTAFELMVLQPADHKLRAIADWLEALLPVMCFLPVLDNGFEPRDLSKLSKDEVVSIVSTFASMLDPRVREVIQDIDIDCILSKGAPTLSHPLATATALAPPSVKAKARKARKKSRKARKAAMDQAADGVPESIPPLTLRASRAVTIEEVPDADAGAWVAPVLDIKGKGRAAVLERISSDSEDELPVLVDVEGNSDEDEAGDPSIEVVRVLTEFARQ